MKHQLFGDYELIINECLSGSPKIKEAVAQADANNRRGLAALKYHLGRSGRAIPTHLTKVLQSCELDQAQYDESVAQDFKSIECRPGTYRVKLTFQGNTFRKVFDNHHDARACRDKISLLFDSIRFYELSEVEGF